MNTRGGRLDDGTGQLEDGSINCMINRADVLEKRKGMVRGLDENFPGVVCGLFRYTDTCGRESVLVAHEDGIAIRSPFVLPVFTASDSYPSDEFPGSAAIDTEDWRNTSRYRKLSGFMVQETTAPAYTGARLASALFQRWFKEASSSSYEVTVNYRLDAAITDANAQRVSVVIRGSGDLGTGALLQMDIVREAATVEAQVSHRDQAGTYKLLFKVGIGTQLTGSAAFFYERDPQAGTFKAKIRVLPTLGLLVEASDPSSLTSLQDANLGGISALAIGQKGGAVSTVLGFDNVAGRPL